MKFFKNVIVLFIACIVADLIYRFGLLLMALSFVVEILYIPIIGSIVTFLALLIILLFAGNMGMLVITRTTNSNLAINIYGFALVCYLIYRAVDIYKNVGFDIPVMLAYIIMIIMAAGVMFFKQEREVRDVRKFIR